MTSGERRFANRLENKLEKEDLCRDNVSSGERTLRNMTKEQAEILADHGIKHVLNPIGQARHYLIAAIHKIGRDPLLIWPSGSIKGTPFARIATVRY